MMMMRRLPAVALALVVVGCKSQPPATPTEKVTVTAVVKGDELQVDRAGQPATVRLLGIHAFSAVKYDPALEDLGTRAKAWTQTRLAGKSVTLILGRTERDAFDRVLAYVTVGGADQNRAMLSAGHAVVYTEYGFAREADYFEAENAARAAKAGLWDHPGAVDLVRSLRSLWSQNRVQRGEPAPADTWLAESPTPERDTPPADLGEVPEPEIP